MILSQESERLSKDVYRLGQISRSKWGRLHCQNQREKAISDLVEELKERGASYWGRIRYLTLCTIYSCVFKIRRLCPLFRSWDRELQCSLSPGDPHYEPTAGAMRQASHLTL